MSSLPVEIYLDILSRIPVKSTFVCKCVSKSWLSMISHLEFVKLHLDRTTETKNSNVMFKSYHAVCSLSSSNEFNDAAVVELNIVNREIPWQYFLYHETSLFGSCNGLVYGYNALSSAKFFFLWNPAIKEYKRLPKPDISYHHHGFGYDYKNQDYKLVISCRDKETTLVRVYSLKSNSWKSLQSIQFEFHPNHHQYGVLFNRLLHWFGIRTSSAVIISMDIGEERFEEMLPPPITVPTQFHMYLGVLEERLCVLARFVQTFDVWVMQDYGVPHSWTKIYSITRESIMGGSCLNVELIGSFKEAEILFRMRRSENSYDLISYDSKYGTSRKIKYDGPYGGAVKYFESLVSLNSITAVGRSKKKKSTRILEKSTTKKRNRDGGRGG